MRRHLVTILGFLSVLVGTAIAGSCSDYLIEDSCQATSNCYWSDGASQCYCNATTTQEIIFALDASGSVGRSDFDNEKSFVNDMIDEAVTDDSLIGIVKFATGAAIYHYFYNSQDRDDVKRTVNYLTWSKWGSTAILWAIQEAIEIYDATHVDGNQRLLMLITDGNPNPSSTQDPCNSEDASVEARADLERLGVRVVIVGVGDDWTPSILSCLVEDDSYIIQANNFTEAALAAVRGQTDSFLCPSSLDVSLTEFRIEPSPAGFVGGDAQFVELYNAGDPWDFGSNNMVLTGNLVSGTIESGFVDKNQYLVLYKSGAADVNCSRCACGSGTLVGTECDNAKYIECTGTCSFSGGATNEDFAIKITDTTENYVVADYVYESSSWPDVSTGWAFELKDTGSWGQSCTSYGTPGDGPLASCDTECYPDLCMSGGDDSATCNSGSCVCNVTAHFYPDDGVCRFLPPPENCNMYIKKDVDGHYQLTEWVVAAVPYDEVYEVNYEDDGERKTSETVAGSNAFVYYDVNAYEDIPPKVRTFLTKDAVEYRSSWATCVVHTSAPSHAPTMSPTFGLPSLTCDGVLAEGTLDLFTVTWTEAVFNEPFTPGNSTGYRVFFFVDGTVFTFEDVGVNVTETTVSLSAATITDPTNQVEIRVSAIVRDSRGDVMADEMRDKGEVCPFTTGVPTVSPTGMPTGGPTRGPTSHPTQAPTQTPTYDPYEITGCEVSLTPGSTSEVEVSFNLQLSDNDGEGDLEYQVRMEVDGNTAEPVILTSNPYAATYADAADSDYFVFPYFTEHFGGSNIKGPGATCVITSSAPSATPTGTPTGTPSVQPTGSPTHSPTQIPSDIPTQSPTFKDIEVTLCTYRLAKAAESGKVESFLLSFYEPEYDYPDTPYRKDVVYIATWTGGSEEMSALGLTTLFERNIDEEITAGDTLKVVVRTDFGSGSEFDLGPEVTCTQITEAPSPAPTVTQTTEPPTYDQPYIYFEPGDECSEPTFIEELGYLFPDCSFDESNAPIEFVIARHPENFPYDIEFDWFVVFNESHVKPNQGKRRLQTTDDPSQGYADENDFSDTSDTGVTLTGGANVARISLTIPREERDENDDANLEFAWIYLRNCRVDEGPSGYTCVISSNTGGDTPFALKLLIDDLEAGQLNKKSKGKMPQWVWAPIAATLCILPVLAYFGWRFYKKRKFAEAELKKREEELEDLDMMGDLDNFNEIGDDVTFNPLATAGTHEIASGGEFIEAQLEAQRKNFETAQVDVEENVFRQDFGPVRGTVTKM